MFKKTDWLLFIMIIVSLLILFIASSGVKADNPAGLFYQLYKQTPTSAHFKPRLPDSSLSSFSACFKNVSNEDYFIPNKTSPEWESFMSKMPTGASQTNCCGDGICGSGETTANCPVDCGTYDPDCVSSPHGIYSGGIYYVQQGVSYNNPAPYPDCGITSAHLGGSNPFYFKTRNFVRDDGIGNKHTNCVALFKSVNKVCNGDLCLKGVGPEVYEGDNSKTLSPDFCYGEYDKNTNTCFSSYTSRPNLVYGQAVVGMNDPDNQYTHKFTYSNNSTTNLTSKAVITDPTWGSCTQCGDGYCDVVGGENTSCPADCVPTTTCNNNGVCDASENCQACSADCGVCSTEPIYKGVAYYAHSGTGDCGLYAPNYTFNASTINSEGLVRCVSLIKATSINNGDTCITGVQQVNQLSPVYCVGQYNAQTNKCVYQQSTGPSMGYLSGETLVMKINNINEAVWGSGSLMNSSDITIGQWGRCY